MSTEIVQWQPATLPEGWRVVRVEVEIGLDRYYGGHKDRVLIVELAHVYGAAFRFETRDPTRINDDGLAALLTAIATSETGLERFDAQFDGRRW